MYQEPFRADHMMDRDRREQRQRRIVGGSLALIALILVSGAFASWHWAFHDLPDTPQSAAELWSVRREPAVTLADREGHVLAVRGPLYARAVALESLPEHVPQAFLAIEDQRFYQHTGVDFRGVARALWRNFRAGETVEGGSTITMQLVKNLLLTPDRHLRRKVQEMRLARALERNLDKTEILELYLNRIYLGARAYGIEAAAENVIQPLAASGNARGFIVWLEGKISEIGHSVLP